ncbi:MAG TPA: DNA-binding domain-containing protein [Gammaproteobacteria bacterium]|nr:DNA-binding domain-containing protein [Gammaproteobacteria bacterium]
MLPLAELQSRVAAALLAGDAGPIAADLAGRSIGLARFGIHLRNYEASLVGALRDKFPACAWLLGAELLDAAARAFVHSHPPRRPCIAEYGADFPRFLATFGRAAELGYVEPFAELEGAVGNAAIAVEAAPVPWHAIASTGPKRLLDARVTLQPGLRYLHVPCRVDQLMAVYLRDLAVPAFTLDAAPAHLEVRGARGAVSIDVLDPAEHSFRAALAAGEAIGAAAERALEADRAFDAGAALRRLVHARFVTELQFRSEGEPS